MDGVLIRPGTIEDIDALLYIEEHSFQTDHISRRSFRMLMNRPTAQIIVAQAGKKIVGYAIILFRRKTALARLYSIAVLKNITQRGIGKLLLQAAEGIAFEEGRVYMRLEVHEENEQAIRLYKRFHYRLIGRYLNYYDDNATALRYEKTLRGDTPTETDIPYYQQTTEFTCGAACLLMAIKHFCPKTEMSPVLEIRLWRGATTVFMLSGPEGCEPYGLAVQAHLYGLSSKIFVSDDAFLFLNSVRDPEKRKVMELAQTDFRAEAAKAQIPVYNYPFGLNDIRAAIARGAVVLVLISFYHMFGEKVPHWVLAHSDDGRHILIHDPWVEEDEGETIADSANLPLSYDVFDHIARFGKDNLRAAVILEKNE